MTIEPPPIAERRPIPERAIADVFMRDDGCIPSMHGTNPEVQPDLVGAWVEDTGSGGANLLLLGVG